ncbi:MAG: hypothetical protein KA138_11340 [Saprospiraceae bacterium]|nr:hypothetical protein [Saprospiraceae bacterium]
MAFHFDIRGHLQPEGLIEITLSEFEEVFVNQFEDSDSRKSIFDNYLRYTKDLRDTIGVGFIQWIDGSFVSNKENPRDIDFATFIDWQIYAKRVHEIDTRFSKWEVDNYYENLDAYTICEYPLGHEFHAIFLADRAYWNEWFSNSRFNRLKKRFSKGFIQIKIA